MFRIHAKGEWWNGEVLHRPAAGTIEVAEISNDVTVAMIRNQND